LIQTIGGGLLSCSTLTRLHLANNKIEVIDGLQNLINLEYLNLRGNRISHVSGLETLSRLDTLHLDKQSSTGKGISFSSETLDTLSVIILIVI
jgi:Leucine-rich repeat (LRR) protein